MHSNATSNLLNLRSMIEIKHILQLRVNILVLVGEGVEDLDVLVFMVGIVAKHVVVAVVFDVVLGEIVLILLVNVEVVVVVLPTIIDSEVSSAVAGIFVVVLVVPIDDTASELIVEIKVGTSRIVAFNGLFVVGMTVAYFVDGI